MRAARRSPGGVEQRFAGLGRLRRGRLLDVFLNEGIVAVGENASATTVKSSSLRKPPFQTITSKCFELASSNLVWSRPDQAPAGPWAQSGVRGPHGPSKPLKCKF